MPNKQNKSKMDNNNCRICLEKATKLLPLFEPVNSSLSAMIMACASVQVIEGDDLPSQICENCVSDLRIAYNFKTLCELSDASLRQSISAQKTEENVDEDNEFPIFVDIEKVSDHSYSIKPVLQTIDSNITILKNIKISNYTNHTSASNVVEDFEPKVPPAKRKKRQELIHSCPICSKVFQLKSSLVHHTRIHTGERPFTCHLCDKQFVCSGHLHTHMRTHTGERKHACATCPKTFATAQQLNKHVIAMHTLERPYGCSICTKRFANSSNLSAHAKIHTGEKNFCCNACDKAFCTKSQLNQHRLVHTGEKAFVCEFCHKRFAQKPHLRRHLKLHVQEKKDAA